MSMNLRKGEWINLSKEAPSLKKVEIGLGWDIKHKFTPYEFELDVSVFMLGGNGKIPHEQYFVFYNNLESLDGSVRFLEDGKLGDGSGESKTFEIDLGQVNPVVQEIVFVITIYDVEGRNSNFGQIQNLLIRIDDNDTKEQVTQYELDEHFSTETAIEFGKLYKQDEEWSFQAVGHGYNSELVNFVEKYAS